METLLLTLVIFLACGLAILLVVLPVFFAFTRGHNDRWAITLFFVLAGWTGLGYFICLIWSLGGDTKKKYEAFNGAR